ncbi:MAG: hypothetical protein AAGI24_01585 [Pseudomonadota bacterium]
MSLENLLKTGQLERHQPTTVELARIIEAADRNLKDAQQTAISYETGLDAA